MKTTQEKQSCTACNAPTEFLYCTPCSIAQTEHLLDSPAWLKVAATRTGDSPGETMVDTMKRELKTLRATKGQ